MKIEYSNVIVGERIRQYVHSKLVVKLVVAILHRITNLCTSIGTWQRRRQGPELQLARSLHLRSCQFINRPSSSSSTRSSSSSSSSSTLLHPFYSLFLPSACYTSIPYYHKTIISKPASHLTWLGIPLPCALTDSTDSPRCLPNPSFNTTYQFPSCTLGFRGENEFEQLG